MVWRKVWTEYSYVLPWVELCTTLSNNNISWNNIFIYNKAQRSGLICGQESTETTNQRISLHQDASLENVRGCGLCLRHALLLSVPSQDLGDGDSS